MLTVQSLWGFQQKIFSQTFMSLHWTPANAVKVHIAVTEPRLILYSQVIAFYCCSGDLQCVCLFRDTKSRTAEMEHNPGALKVKIFTASLHRLIWIPEMRPDSGVFFLQRGKSAEERSLDVCVACRRPLSCENVTHFLFHLQALHDLVKTEGQRVFCGLTQHWLMHISHEEQWIFFFSFRSN